MPTSSTRRLRPRAIAARALAAGLASLLAGCTLGPDFTEPKAPDATGYTEEGIPDTHVADAKEKEQRFVLGKKIAAEWWQLFHVQRLNDVLDQAIAGNQTLAAARATLAQAREAVTVAAGPLYPQIDVAGSASRERVSLAPIGQRGRGPVINLFTLGPIVSYSLDPFGGNRRRVEAQGALADLQDYQLDAAYLTLTGDAVTQALAIATARAQLKAVESIIRDDEENLRLVKGVLGAGEGTQLDVQIAASQLAADRTLLPGLRQQLSAARHALSILLGRLPSAWVPPDFELEEFTLPEELPMSLPSELVRQRPDILAAEAELHAASAGIGVATAQLYPNITLTSAFTQEALSATSLFNPSSSVWDVGAQLLAPVFHGGALEAQRRAAVDAYDAALATYEQTVLVAFGQVADVMQALKHDGELLEAQRRALESAEATLRLTRTTYQYGNVGVLQVLDAQRLAEQARLGYVRAQAQRYLDTVQFLTAMGGGWWDWQARDDAARPAMKRSSAR
jgi:NodT family efflux transporter outer membrane factor (OMF) lipoprotein